MILFDGSEEARNMQIWIGNDDTLCLYPEKPDGDTRLEYERAGEE